MSRFIATAARIAVSVLVFTVLFGCSARRDDSAQSASTTENAVATDSLVVYTYDVFPEALEKLIDDHFAASGVTPHFERFQDTGELYNEVFLTRDTPKADVVIGLDTTYVGRSLSDNLFQAYRPQAADHLESNLIVDDRFRLTPFDWGNIVLNYDSEKISDPPKTWNDLLDPRFRKSIIMMNPATSSPGRNFLLLTIAEMGPEAYVDYWARLKPNILTVTAGWSEGYGLYTQGEAPIVLSYETSPAYHIEYENTDRYQNLIIDDKGYAQIELAGITRGAANLLNARALIDYILTPEFQSEIPLNQFMYPVDASVPLPDSFKQVDRPGTSVRLPTDEVDAHFPKWLADWEAVMR